MPPYPCYLPPGFAFLPGGGELSPRSRGILYKLLGSRREGDAENTGG